MSNHKEMKWTKWDSGRPHNKKSETAMCTSLQRPFSSTTSQTKLLDSTDRALDSDRMGGGAAECVYIIDDGCSNVVKVYGQRLPEVKLGQVENPGSWYSDP